MDAPALPLPALKLSANGVRRASWDAKLGKTASCGFRVALGSLLEGGGQAPCVHVRVERRYGLRVYERPEGDAAGRGPVSIAPHIPPLP